MNRQTMARVKHILKDYEDETSAGAVLLTRTAPRCEIAVAGSAKLLAGAYACALIDYIERHVNEGQEQEFLTKFVTHVYEQVLQCRKEKADEANDQGQPGQ